MECGGLRSWEDRFVTLKMNSDTAHRIQVARIAGLQVEIATGMFVEKKERKGEQIVDPDQLSFSKVRCHRQARL
jgi:hypothetical protein